MYVDKKKMMVGEMCCFSSLQPGKVLKEKAAAKIYFERNLYEDFCRDGNYIPCTVFNCQKFLITGNNALCLVVFPPFHTYTHHTYHMCTTYT